MEEKWNISPKGLPNNTIKTARFHLSASPPPPLPRPKARLRHTSPVRAHTRVYLNPPSNSVFRLSLLFPGQICFLKSFKHQSSKHRVFAKHMMNTHTRLCTWCVRTYGGSLFPYEPSLSFLSSSFPLTKVAKHPRPTAIVSSSSRVFPTWRTSNNHLRLMTFLD